jgi:hypothetical protein
MQKKKFQAIKADVGDYKGIVHDGKKYHFRRDDTFIIEDAGLAREMDQTYGIKGTQKVAITPYDDPETREPGHKYTFGPMTSKAAAEFWQRYEKKRRTTHGGGHATQKR